MARRTKPSMTKNLPDSQKRSLAQRLKEAEETLQAIRQGSVDALVVESGEDDRVYTLKSADYPYRLIFDHMMQGAVIFDDQGVIFYANTTFAGMVNHPIQQMFGISIDALVTEEDREFFKTMDSSHPSLAGRTGTISLSCQDRNNLEVFVGLISLNIDGQYLNCAILTDLTEQKKYDAALAEEKFSRMILEQTGEAVIVCDTSGCIIRNSHAAERLIQRNVIHKQFQDLFHLVPSYPSVHANNLGGVWNQEKSVVEKVLDGVRFKGLEADLWVEDKKFPLLINAQPLQDDAERTIGAIITMTDITSRKKAEQDLQEINNSLEQRISDRTHDLMKYQEHLRGMASELAITEQRERRRLATELHDYLAQLLVVCRMKLGQINWDEAGIILKPTMDDMDKHLTDALAYTRTLIAELSPTILFELGIVPALVWLGEQLEGQGLRVQIRDEHTTIQLPEDQAIFVFQAVRELLFNVIKHAGVTEATVSLHRHANGALEVQVQDSGKGFQSPLDSSDFTTPEKFGIFSIRERMEALGGQFYIQTAPGQGTRATLIVPLKTGISPDVPTPDSRRTRKSFPSSCTGVARKKVVRVLLVDDHAMVRQGIRTLLENQEDLLVVGEAENGEEALEISKRIFPEVVVMDVNMPKLNGIEATRILTTQYPSIRVIGLSVHEDKQVEKLMIEAGAAGYVKKGSVASQLVQAIHHVVA